MKNSTLSFALAATFALMAPAAHATIINVVLDGPQAGVVSPGLGTAVLTLDDVANTLLVDMTFSGLTTPTTNAHIHCCAPPGVAAGVVIPFAPPFVTGTTSGHFVNLFSLTAVQVQDIYSGLSYINIHTTNFPGGEIRGQIPHVVPEPATAGLIGAAIAALALLRRKVTA
jgi:hypothetical protein